MNKELKEKIDWVSMFVPLTGVGVLSVFFMLSPEHSAFALTSIREFLGNDCGIYYAVLGIGI